MKRGKTALSFFAFMLSFSLNLTAEEFHLVGSRAMGMGGAGVAVTRGVLSTYWNPAGLCPPSSAEPAGFFELALPLAVMGAASRNALRELDEVIDLSAAVDFRVIEERLAAGKPLTAEQVRSLLALAEELPGLESSGNGFLTDVSLGLGLRLDRFAFNSVGLYSAGAVTRLDRRSLALGNQGIEGILPPGQGRPVTPEGLSLVNDLVNAGLLARPQADHLVFLAEQAGVDLNSTGFRGMVEDILEATSESTSGSSGEFITANQSGVEVSGILVTEYVVSYSQPLKDWFTSSPLNTISVGASLKVMNAKTFFSPFSLTSLEDFEGVDGDLLTEAREETSMNIGFDLGLLAEPTDWLSLGLVARNLNSPSFDFAKAGDYELDPQVRMGVGVYDLAPGLVLAADLDLTRNHTDALPGYDSQQLAAGLEYSIPGWENFFLRGGLSKNLASGEGAALHFGLGFSLADVSFDMAAMVIPRLTEVDRGTDGGPLELPERAGLSLMIGCQVPLR